MAKGKIMGMPIWAALVIAVLAVVVLAPTLGIKLPAFAVSGTGTPATPPAIPANVQETCEGSTGIGVTYTAYDALNPGSALTDYNVTYFVNGVLGGVTATGTQFTVASDSVLTLYLQDSSGHDVYSYIDTVHVGCKPLVLQAAKGMQDGSLTLTVYQSDDITANSEGAPETLGSGADALGRMRVKEATNDAFWSTTEGGQKFLVIADLNSQAFSTFEVTSATPSTAVAKVAVPSGHSSLDTTNCLLSVAYEVTSDNLRDYGVVDVAFRAPAMSGINPGTDSNINITVSDKELYLNTLTGQYMLDYRNAVTNADLGETDATDEYHIA